MRAAFRDGLVLCALVLVTASVARAAPTAPGAPTPAWVVVTIPSGSPPASPAVVAAARATLEGIVRARPDLMLVPSQPSSATHGFVVQARVEIVAGTMRVVLDITELPSGHEAHASATGSVSRGAPAIPLVDLARMAARGAWGSAASSFVGP